MSKMKSGMNFEQGDIVIVPFPFSNLSDKKRRPVLVLSKTEDNLHSLDIITCGITSNLANEKYSVLIDNDSLEFGSIPNKSRIRADKLFTIDKDIIIKKVAKVKKEFFEEVRNQFKSLLS